MTEPPITPTTILGALQTYIGSYSGLPEGAPVWANLLGPEPVQYSIVPLPGARTVEEDLVGNRIREFPFAFQSMEDTSEELQRFATMSFFEAFADWLDEQNDQGSLPTLGDNKTATAIEATNWAFLFQEGNSSTGVYQIQCKLTFEQKKGS